MAAISVGQPSSGEFRSANPQGDSFRPLLELGRGGMARVYLAEKTTRGLRRLVVLKALEPSLAVDAEMRSLFRREAEVCARLHHPNVVQVFEVIDEATFPFMVMEYVEGVSLSQVLARTEQRLPIRLHLHVLMQVLAGLHYFHELRDEDGNELHGVHRDVSPQNVIVMHEGVVKVLDFGIAKLRDPDNAEVTRAGIIKGKLSYMPPEQLLGDASIDRRADVFAVGVMLWEAFARRRMWEGWAQQDMMKALMAGTLPSLREACPWISKAAEAVVERAIAPKREDRYASALDLQMALEECMVELGGFVQQREVASFMEAEFGEWRRERQRTVDAEVRKPAMALAEVLDISPAEEASLESESLQHGHVRSSIHGLERERRFVVPALGLLLVGLAAAFLLFARAKERAAQPLPPPAAAPLVAPDAPPTVREAPAAAAEPIAPPSAAVEVAEAPSAAAEAPEPPSGKPNGRVRQPAPRVAAPRPGAVPTPTPAAAPEPPAVAAPAAPPRNCTPPYVLDKEGVKTYKPECL